MLCLLVALITHHHYSVSYYAPPFSRRGCPEGSGRSQCIHWTSEMAYPSARSRRSLSEKDQEDLDTKKAVGKNKTFKQWVLYSNLLHSDLYKLATMVYITYQDDVLVNWVPYVQSKSTSNLIFHTCFSCSMPYDCNFHCLDHGKVPLGLSEEYKSSWTGPQNVMTFVETYYGHNRRQRYVFYATKDARYRLHKGLSSITILVIEPV